MRVFLKRSLETLIVAIAATLFLGNNINSKLCMSANPPVGMDHWIECFLLEHQVTRISGINPGGLWDGGFLYPFEKVSLLFSEPRWGVSLAILPFWLVIRNIFVIYALGGALALILSWAGTYWFARELGCKRIYAFFAAMTFCLSEVGLTLLGDKTPFWLFFLIPYLGWLIIKIFKVSRPILSMLFGILYGYIAWTSGHLAVMGGSFLFCFALWQLWMHRFPERQKALLAIAFFIAVVISLTVYLPMYKVFKEFGRVSACMEQPYYGTNWINLIYRRGDMPLSFMKFFRFWGGLKNYAEGGCPTGISSVLLLVSVFSFFSYLLGCARNTGNNATADIKIYFYYSLPVFFAILNIFALKYAMPMIKVEVMQTIFYYFIIGAIVMFFRNEFLIALRQLPFFLFLLAVLFTIFAFGPYYLTASGSAIPSPLIIFLCFVPGFYSVREVSRWGLLASFNISLAVSLALSKYKTKNISKIIIGILVLLCFSELFLGFPSEGIRFLKPYEWKPREVDIYLKNIHNRGAVFELRSYPIFWEDVVYDMYASLYHKKPIITGIATVLPEITSRYLYDCEERLTPRRIEDLRKFGARYWVFHMDKWPKEDAFEPGEYIGALKRIASLDDGRTLVYEDPNPRVAITNKSLLEK